MSMFLQITPSYEGMATFKCLGCQQRVAAPMSGKWKFCPLCGGPIAHRLQSCERRHSFNPNGPGCWTDARGTTVIEYRHVPVFRLLVETNYWGERWESASTITGPHARLKHTYRRALDEQKKQKHGMKETRVSIVPSQPLPLP